MGNYISNDSTKQNALILIADYMVKGVPRKWWSTIEANEARYICRKAFTRIIKCSDSPLNVIENMYGEYEQFEEKCGKDSRYAYCIGTEVISDILNLMS